MPAPVKVDVVVAVLRISSRTLRSLQELLEIRDPALGRLMVVAGPSLDRSLESFAQGFPKLSIVRRPDDPQGVAAWNRGLLERGGDVVLLAADTMVTPGWLSELSAVARSEERTAFAWPLSNRIAGGSAREAFSGLPASTTAETTEGECVYLRGPIVDAVGLLDASLSTLQFAVKDWVMRAQALGFFGKRANHAYVEHAGPAAGSDELSQALLRDRAIVHARHPYWARQVESFRCSLDGSLARHAADFIRTGKLPIVYDIRHLTPRSDRARTNAIRLAETLALNPAIELTYLISDPAQALGLSSPAITPEVWRDEFAVIHRPAPFFSREDLAIPFASSAHVIVSYQDSSSYAAPEAFASDPDQKTYASTRSLSLLCAQGIVADSERTRGWIASEFGIPGTEIAVDGMGGGADLVFRVYKSAVLNPGERSLQARRLYREAILGWSSPPGRRVRIDRAEAMPDRHTAGVRDAWKALRSALKRRVKREMHRLGVARQHTRI